MNDLIVPDPVLDARETKLLVALTDDYRKFTSPGRLSKGLATVRKYLANVTPDTLTNLAREAVGAASQSEFIRAAITHAGRGFQKLVKQASWLTKSPEGVLEALNSSGMTVNRFDYICCQRSYHIEKVATALNYVDILAALTEGAITGFPGLVGLPFNIALSFFLYFRAAQSIALYYGYDVNSDPRELEFASETTLFSLAPTLDTGLRLSGVLWGR